MDNGPTRDTAADSTSTPTVAVAHHCEGAGHATRMLAVVEELEAAGYEVVIAGGGPGAKFVEANGYDEYEPPTVDFIDDFQGGGGVLDVLRHSAPTILARIDRYRDWLASVSPALLVTDDISGVVAATVSSQRYVYVSHDPAGFYANPVERVGAWLRNRLPRATAERFLLPKVWPGEPTIPGADAIPPMAPPNDGAEPSVDVLVVPSAYSVDADRLRDALEARGRDVTLVGGDDWEIQPSLQPYVAGANLVVCSGYSTVMESAVAGTPCVVLPATSEQRGVADAVGDLDGFYVADSVDGVVAALDHIEPPERRENGAERVAGVVARLVPPEPAANR